MNIPTRAFGKLPTGETVEEFTLTNARGLTLKLITYGGTITELHVPDPRGVTADVVLGFQDLAGYLGNHPYFGCIAGRVSGRITGGKFLLDGRNYQLLVNDPPNHLHGGAVGFDKRLWRPQIVENGVRLTYRSPHGEEGYPGNVDVAVTYSLTDANEIFIRYEAVTDAPTPLSLTNHSYFNLAGEGSGTIEDHLLHIASSHIAQTDAQMTLLGTRAPVAGQPNDFRYPIRLGHVLADLLNSHGDNYFLAHPTSLKSRRRGDESLTSSLKAEEIKDSSPRLLEGKGFFNGRLTSKTLERAALLADPSTGRVMEVLTTEECLQLYTGAGLNGSLVGKSGRPYPKFGGLCLECQGYPDGANHPELGDIILRPGETYQQTTIYRFLTP